MVKRPQKPMQTMSKTVKIAMVSKKVPLLSHPWPTLLTELIDPISTNFLIELDHSEGNNLLIIYLLVFLQSSDSMLKLRAQIGMARRLLLDQAKAKQTEILSIFAWPTFAKKCL